MLDTARRIIASKGLISLKVRDIAEAAQCSIGSVYNEFGDFDGLILTVNRETVQLLTSKLRTIPSDDPRVQLQGDSATVRTVLVRRITPRVGSRQSYEGETEFRLRRSGGTWLITDVIAAK